MFQKLVNRNPDLTRLVERGFAVAFDSNCLIVRDIPYLDAGCTLSWGAIVAKLEFVDKEMVGWSLISSATLDLIEESLGGCFVSEAFSWR